MPIPEWDTHDPSARDARALSRAYITTLQGIVKAVDADRLAQELPDPSTVDAVLNGDGGDVELEDAAAVLAFGSELLDGAAIHAELLDRLLIGMSNAVVDVDTLATEVSLDFSGKELQQRIEGRAPMTVSEYAHVRHAIARRTP